MLRAAGGDEGKIQIVDQGFGSRDGSGIIAPDQAYRQGRVAQLFKNVGDRDPCGAQNVFLEQHVAVHWFQALLNVYMPVSFHAVGTCRRYLLYAAVLSGIEGAGAAEHDRLDQRGAGGRDAAVLDEIVPYYGGAARGNWRRHAAACLGDIILASDAGQFPAGIAGVDAGAGGHDVWLDAAV